MCARRSAENLNTSRSARLASFVTNGHTRSGEVGFASTDEVLRDARKAGSPETEPVCGIIGAFPTA